MAVLLVELTELVMVLNEEMFKMFEELTMTGKAKNRTRFVEEEKIG